MSVKVRYWLRNRSLESALVKRGVPGMRRVSHPKQGCDERKYARQESGFISQKGESRQQGIKEQNHHGEQSSEAIVSGPNVIEHHNGRQLRWQA